MEKNIKKNMKNLLLFLVTIFFTISQADYSLKVPLENSNGGFLANGSIIIKPSAPVTPPENLDFSKISVGHFSVHNGITYIGYSSGVESTHGNFGTLIRAGIKNINGFYVNLDPSGSCELNITGSTSNVNSISTFIIDGKTYNSNYIWQQPLNGSYLNRRSVNCSLLNDLQNLINTQIIIEFL